MPQMGPLLWVVFPYFILLVLITVMTTLGGEGVSLGLLAGTKSDKVEKLMW